MRRPETPLPAEEETCLDAFAGSFALVFVSFNFNSASIATHAAGLTAAASVLPTTNRKPLVGQLLAGDQVRQAQQTKTSLAQDVGGTSWITTQEQEEMPASGSASTGEREKRSKKRRRKRKMGGRLIMPLFASCWLVLSLVAVDVVASGRTESDGHTAESLSVISAFSPKADEEVADKSDILEQAIRSPERSVGNLKARGHEALANNCSGPSLKGCSTDSYNEIDKRRLSSKQNALEKGESDTDTSDIDNETDNGSENDNDISAPSTITGYHDDADDGGDYNNASAATTPNTTAPSRPFISLVTRLHDGRRLSLGQSEAPAPAPAQAQAEADEDEDEDGDEQEVQPARSAGSEALDDSADDYNDYGAYVIYEHEPDDQGELASLAIDSQMRYAPLAGNDLPRFQQVFYASQRKASHEPHPSETLFPDESHVDEQQLRREDSNQLHSVSNSSTSELMEAPTSRKLAIRLKSRSTSDNKVRPQEEKEIEEEDVKWLARMMTPDASGFGERAADKQSNQEDPRVSSMMSLLEADQLHQRTHRYQERAESEEVTNRDFQLAGDLRQQHLSNGSSRANLSLNTSAQFPEAMAEQEKDEHRVYYWRLIWFVLPVGATFGNLLVIMAVYLERSLQSVTNYFIVSLAFADLFVGLVVMPFAVYVLVNGVWELSDTICDIYVAVDVTSSTASILNLVAISIDRYRAVAHPIAYSARTSSTRAILTILLVWFISCCVGAPIILGLNTSPERNSSLCILYNSTFIFWSSLTSFYVPCIIMIGLYWRIFLAIRSRTKKAIQTSSHGTQPSATGAALAHSLHHPSTMAPTKAGAAVPGANHKSPCTIAAVALEELSQSVVVGRKQSNFLEADADGVVLSGAKLQTAQALPSGSDLTKLGEGATTATTRRSILAAPENEKRSIEAPSTFATQVGGLTSFEAEQGQASSMKDRQVSGSDPVDRPLLPALDGRAGSAPASEIKASMSHSSLSKEMEAGGGSADVHGKSSDASNGKDDNDDNDLQAYSTVVCPLAEWRRATRTSEAPSNQHEIYDEDDDYHDELSRRLAGERETDKDHDRDIELLEEEEEEEGGGEVNENENESDERKEMTQAQMRLTIGRAQLRCCCSYIHQPGDAVNLQPARTCLRDFFLPNVMRFNQEMSSLLLPPPPLDFFSEEEMKRRSCDIRIAQQNRHSSSSAALMSATNLCSAITALLSLSLGLSDERKQTLSPLVKVCLPTDLSCEMNEGERSTWIYVKICADIGPQIKHGDEKSPEAHSKDEVDCIEANIRDLENKLESLMQNLEKTNIDQSASFVQFIEILHQKCQVSRPDTSCHDNNNFGGTCCGCCGLTMDQASIKLDASIDSLKLRFGQTQSVCIGPGPMALTGRTKLLVDQWSVWSRTKGFEQLQIYRQGSSDSSCSHQKQITWFSKILQPNTFEFRLRLCNGAGDGRQQLCAACRVSCRIGHSLRLHADSSETLSGEQNDGKSSAPMGESAASGAASKEEADEATERFCTSACSWAMIDPLSLNLEQSALVRDMDSRRKLRQTSHSGCTNLSKLLEEERLRQAKGRSIDSSSDSPAAHCRGYANDNEDEEEEEDEDDEEEEEDNDGDDLVEAESECRSSRSSSPDSQSTHCNYHHPHHSFASSRSSLSSSSSLTGYDCSAHHRGDRYDFRRSSQPSCCRLSPTCLLWQSQQSRHPNNKMAVNSRTALDSNALDSGADMRAAIDAAPTSRPKSSRNILSATNEQEEKGVFHSMSNLGDQARDKSKVSPTASHAAAFHVIQNATQKLKRRSIRLGKFLKQTTLKTAGLTDPSEVTQTPPGGAQTKNPSSDDQLTSSVLATNVAAEKLISASLSGLSTTNNQIPAQALSSTSATSQGPQISQSQVAQAGSSLVSPSTSQLVRGYQKLPAEVRKHVEDQGEKHDGSANNLDEDDSCSEEKRGDRKIKDRQRERRSKKSKTSTEEDEESLEHQRQQRRDIKRSFLVASVINLIQQQQGQPQSPGAQEHKANQLRGQKAKKSVDSKTVSGSRQHRAGGSRRRRQKNAARRERKATKTLAIVLGIFLICWTPFFTCNIIDGICIQLNMDCRPGMMVYLVTSWLGYVNSCVNPIIYTIFNMEFRRAFKRILKSTSCC